MAYGYGRGYESIHRNQDGIDGVAETYTICRIGVSRRRLVKEIDRSSRLPSRQQVHPDYHVVQLKSGAFVRNNPQISSDNINHEAPWRCMARNPKELSREGSLTSFLGFESRSDTPPHERERIHGEQGHVPGGNQSYTVCRFGVSRQRLIEEVEAGMHPGIKVVQEDGEKRPWLPSSALRVCDQWRLMFGNG